MVVPNNAPLRWMVDDADFGSPMASSDGRFRATSQDEEKPDRAAAIRQHECSRYWQDAATKAWRKNVPSSAAKRPTLKWIAQQVPGLTYVDVKAVLNGERRMTVRHIVALSEAFGEVPEV